jgi:fatty acid desaturase
MHDGAHKSITKTKFDYFIMNFCSGLIILPFYTELFKKFHLMHHAYTNSELDPLWSDNKKRLFEERRKLYAVLQCLPFAFNLAVLFGFKKRVQQNKVKTPPISIPYMLFSLAIALTVIYFARPSFWFVLGTFTIMTTLGAIRYWGEHMGTKNGKESNTHWFPLGMGIGNHEVHHYFPGYSWLTLTIGMLSRKMDTNPIKSIYGILFDKSFHHYSPKKK